MQKRLAFKMKLYAGMAVEYKIRHDEIWPELAILLKQYAISDYFIFLDEETNTLFASYLINNEEGLKGLSEEPLMKKWWHYMQDIMETNEDASPISIPLKHLFYLG
ncbi:MAG TPA: L-rhamnose mutarotase [Arachidicoccus soli]|nr:L-rhamnose mutarotase [Arachidicoccus soli]